VQKQQKQQKQQQRLRDVSPCRLVFSRSLPLLQPGVSLRRASAQPARYTELRGGDNEKGQEKGIAEEEDEEE
jgi:hypothetical protein